MDIVLEIADTLFGDYLYATFHPAKPAPYDFPHPPSNETVNAKAFSAWTYKPSTHYFSLEPSQYAYMSQWPRDNIFRQALSLFLIVW